MNLEISIYIPNTKLKILKIFLTLLPLQNYPTKKNPSSNPYELKEGFYSNYFYLVAFLYAFSEPNTFLIFSL